MCIFQVDEPYKMVKLRADIPTDSIQRAKWPHWKERTGDQVSYQSETVLGRIWDHMEEKLKKATAATADQKADDQILGYIQRSIEDKLVHRDTVLTMRSSMKKEVEHYLKGRTDECPMKGECSRDSYFGWNDHFCKGVESRLILSQPGEDRKRLAAAVLYEQAVKYCDGKAVPAKKRKAPISFAWAVAKEYLCRITSDAASERTGRCPVPVHPDSAKVMFTGRR
jgi:hypothetical protein